MMKFSILACIISIVYSDCVLYNNGTLPPMFASPDRTKPRDYSTEWSDSPACPDFVGVDSCCSDASNAASYDNFGKIRTAFGNQGGGCDLCAANIQRFFCYFACAPNQSEFMKFIEYKEMEVWNTTTNKLMKMNVTSVELNYSASQGCDLFHSCSKISFLTQISAGGSAQGFFTFLFDRGIEDSAIEVKVRVVNEGGLAFVTPPHKCNVTYPNGTDEFGYEIKGSCPCNFCEDSCLPLDLTSYGSILDGFNFNNVILAYLFAGLLTLGITFLRGFRRKRTALTPSQRNFLDNSATE